jgi:Dyp-type peroxidase family
MRTAISRILHPGQYSKQKTITVLAPIPEAALAEVNQRLDLLRARVSPFGRVPGTHFARLAVLARSEFKRYPRPKGMHFKAKLLDLVVHGARQQQEDQPSASYLLFSASYDGTAGAPDDHDYLERLRVGLGREADEIWGLCSGYPGWSDPEGFRSYLAGLSLTSRYVFSASDAEPSVGQIQTALRLRNRITELALDTEGLPDDALAAHLRKVFEAPGGWDAGAPAASPAGTSAGSTAGAPPGTSDALPGGQLPAVVDEVEPTLVDPPTDQGQLGFEDPLTDPDLADVQNLVTSGYPRHRASRHLFLRVTNARAAREWLSTVIDEVPDAGWAERYVDRLDKDLEKLSPDPTAGPEGRPGSPAFAAHLALSYAGLVRLGVPERDLRGFATEFQVGMAKREAGLTPGRGTRTWQAPFAEPDGEARVHVLLMVSAADPTALDEELAIRPGLVPVERDGLVVLDTIEAGRIPEDLYGSGSGAAKPGFLEHFGFVDGLSQPRIHGVTAGRRSAELPPGEALLGYEDVDGDTAGAGLPASLARNGSYLVYRKLEQDVHAFRDLTRDLASMLETHAPSGTDLPELAAAKLMGRWRDGTPLTLSTGRSQQELAKEVFAFQQSDALGFGCPVGAHIRRANPRDSRPVDPNTALKDGGNPNLEKDLALRHRMLRRGIPYGTPLPPAEFDDLSAPDASASPDSPERGLLFIALVGDIRRQFEFVQAHWMSDGNAFRLGGDVDIFSGAAQDGTKFVVQGPEPTFIKPDVARPVVTCRGGEYFFLPGLSALRQIARG